LSDSDKIYIIGIGDDGLDGLTSQSRQIVNQAEVILGSSDALAAAEDCEAERIDLGNNWDGTVERIAALTDRRVVILATGDPLFYGTARYLCDKLGKDRFEVVPHVSSMQLAFARVKESWDEAYLTNLATQPLARVVERIRTAEKVGVFTSEEVQPADLAKALLDSGIDYFTAYICENLGSPDERVTHSELSEIAAEQSFAPLNVMILVRKPNVPDRPATMAGKRLFGNPDEAFLQSRPKRGLLTPFEIRSVALAEMDIGPHSVVWDVGAGSGAVAIEAAQIASGGNVFAIECDTDDHQLISQNAQRFGVGNLTAILGQAPEAWNDLPDPDVIFIGGTGRAVGGLTEAAFGRLRNGGRIVINVNSLENVTDVRNSLKKAGEDPNVWMFNFARGNYQFETVRFESINPTFLISARKGE
jgi:precorrin-6Y C5,15-methyltransferase (decarboxylating)